MTTNGHSNGTVQFFDSVLAPRGKSPASRKSWGIDLEADWVPFFTAAKVAGKVNIADDVLGAPIRQAYNDDGTPKFSQSGRPVRRVHKDIVAHVTIARENFVAAMRSQVAVVATEQADAYRDQVAAQQRAGQPLREADDLAVEEAEEAMRQAEEAERQRILAEAACKSESEPTPTPSGRSHNSRNPEPEPEPATVA